MKTYEESIEIFKDARSRLAEFIGASCECDNTHKVFQTQCCLCDCNEALERLKERVMEKETTRIEVTIMGGCVHEVLNIPEGAVVRIRDYDCDSYDVENVVKDDMGVYCVESWFGPEGQQEQPF